MSLMIFGTQELLVVLAILLLLFGASRLPKLAKALGKSVRALKVGELESTTEENKKG